MLLLLSYTEQASSSPKSKCIKRRRNSFTKKMLLLYSLIQAYTSYSQPTRTFQKSKMQLVRLILAAALTVLSVEACQCVNPEGGASNDGATGYCCGQEGGTFVGGNQCVAGSISNNLSGFEHCCRGSGLNSDCSCPTC